MGRRQPVAYLAGPINGRTDAECNGWLAAAKGLLRCDTLDPVARDYRGKEAETARAIVEGDKADISRSDAVLVYFDRPSVGTSMEVLFAWTRGLPVVVVNASGNPLSPWLAYHATATSDSLEAACAWLNARLKV